MSPNRLVNWLIVGSIALMATAFFMDERLPVPDSLGPALQAEPDQQVTHEAPFDTEVEGVRYTITPRFTYDISGLVVSLHHSDTWWDYAHKAWNDHINIADLCVVWGENVRRDAYRRAKYGHTQWECWVSYRTDDPAHRFDGTALSNNHIVTSDPAIAHALRDVHIGDEVHVRGYLIDYSTYVNGRMTGTRKTSIVRTDEGEGACEVIWAQELSIVKSHDRAWRIAGYFGAALLLIGLIAWAWLPATVDDSDGAWH